MTDAERIEFEIKLSRLQKFIMNSTADEMSQLKKDIVDIVETLAHESIDNKILTATEVCARNMEGILYQKQRQVMLEKIKKKNKIIDAMASYISRYDNDETICKGIECYDQIYGCRTCIKQYFERRVEDD